MSAPAKIVAIAKEAVVRLECDGKILMTSTFSGADPIAFAKNAANAINTALSAGGHAPAEALKAVAMPKGATLGVVETEKGTVTDELLAAISARVGAECEKLEATPDDTEHTPE